MNFHCEMIIFSTKVSENELQQSNQEQTKLREARISEVCKWYSKVYILKI